MARRPYWQGQLRLALVSIPVAIYTGTRSDASFSFRMIHKPSGKPIEYKKVAEGVGEVDSDDIVKGYEYESDRYVLLDPEEIDAVRLDSRKTLELVKFVDRAAIPLAHIEKPYYVVPADDLAQEAYIVLREALEQTGKAGIGQLAMRGREELVCLSADGRGMLLETLRYADELHPAEASYKDVARDKPNEELTELAISLIEKRAGEFDPSAFKDKYGDAVRDLVGRKMKNKNAKITIEDDSPAPKASSGSDLMAAFKKSLSASRSAGTRATTRRAAAPAKKKARG